MNLEFGLDFYEWGRKDEVGVILEQYLLSGESGEEIWWRQIAELEFEIISMCELQLLTKSVRQSVNQYSLKYRNV